MVVLVVKGLSTGSDRERFQHQGLGGVQRLDVGLVRARRRNHVHHFLHRIDVRQRDVAVRVGRRIAGVVGRLHRRRVVDHAGDLHAADLLAGARARASDRRNPEHHLLGLVRLTVRAGRAVGVGEVRRRHVEPLRLRGHRGACNTENIHQRRHVF
jgi:hypothetical protein